MSRLGPELEAAFDRILHFDTRVSITVFIFTFLGIMLAMFFDTLHSLGLDKLIWGAFFLGMLLIFLGIIISPFKMKFYQAGMFVWVLSFIGLGSLGWLRAANHIFDSADAHMRLCQIAEANEKDIRYGFGLVKSRTFKLECDDGFKGSIDVSKDHFKKYSQLPLVVLKLKPGALGYEWVEDIAQATPRQLTHASDEITKWIGEHVHGLKYLDSEQIASVRYAIEPFFSRINNYKTYKPFYDRLYEKPFVRVAPFFINLDDGIYFAILGPNEKLTELPPYKRLAGKTVEEVFGYTGDKRVMDDLPGEGTRQTVVVLHSDINHQPTGRYNTYYHEFGHFVLFTVLTEEEFRRVQELYANAIKKNLALSDYAARNSSEYFAVAFEAYISGHKTELVLNDKGEPSRTRNFSRGDLLKKDRALHDFFKKLVGEK